MIRKRPCGRPCIGETIPSSTLSCSRAHKIFLGCFGPAICNEGGHGPGFSGRGSGGVSCITQEAMKANEGVALDAVSFAILASTVSLEFDANDDYSTTSDHRRKIHGITSGGYIFRPEDHCDFNRVQTVYKPQTCLSATSSQNQQPSPRSIIPALVQLANKFPTRRYQRSSSGV